MQMPAAINLTKKTSILRGIHIPFAQIMMTQSSVKYQDKIIGQNAKCKGGRYRIESGIFSAARKWVGVLRVYSSAAGQLLVNTLFLPNAP